MRNQYALVGSHTWGFHACVGGCRIPPAAARAASFAGEAAAAVRRWLFARDAEEE